MDPTPTGSVSDENRSGFEPASFSDDFEAVEPSPVAMFRESSGFARLLKSPLRILDEIRLVAAWDMTRQARRPSFFLMRTALAGFIAFQVVMLWWGQIEKRQWLSESSSGAVLPVNQLIYAIDSMFRGSVLMMSIGVILFCPALTSGTIAGDRERKIWHDMANSPLSGWSILMGKMVARLATVFAWILVAMPLWALLSLIGGLDPRSISLIMLCLFFYGWIYAALGMLASVATKRSRDALGLVTAFVCLLVFVPIVGTEIARELGLPTFLLKQVMDFAQLFDPAMTLRVIPYWLSDPGKVNYNAWISLPAFLLLIGLTGPTLTLIAGLLLRPLGRRLDADGTRDQASLKPSAARKPRRLPLPGFTNLWPIRILQEPMIVKERRVRSGSRLTRNLRRVALALYFAFSSFFFLREFGEAFFEWTSYGYYGSPGSKRDALMAMTLFITGFNAFLLHYGLMLDAAGRFVMEKEQDTWTTLLSTPLTPGEILAGKAFGALWSWRWTFLHLGLAWGLALLVGAMNPLGLLCALAVWTIQLGFVTILGLRIGMNSSSHGSIVSKCIGLFLIHQIVLPIIANAVFRNDSGSAIQPVFMAAISIAAGQPEITRIISNSLIYVVLWELLLAVVSALLVVEILTSFDRKTGREETEDIL